MMSKEMGLSILFLGGSLLLVLLWTAASFLGLVGGAIARNLSPPRAAMVVFLFLAGAPMFAGSLYTYEHLKQEPGAA